MNEYRENRQLRNLILKYQLIIVFSISLLSFFVLKTGMAFIYGMFLGVAVSATNLLILSYSTGKTIALMDRRLFNSAALGYFSRLGIFGLVFYYSLTVGTMAAAGMLTTYACYFASLFITIFFGKIDESN